MTQFRYVSTFSTKFWYFSTFSTQPKSVRFCSTQFRYVLLFLPKFGIFRLPRLNKKCSILFDPVQIGFNFVGQILLLVFFDFLDSTKKMFDFVRPSSDMLQLSRPSFAFGVFCLSRLNKRVFDLFNPVHISFAFSTNFWYISTFLTQ